MKIENLFPVQRHLIPIIQNKYKNQSIYPNDLCILAPTGSGKTLTYVLPIINQLKNRIRPCCRAIVLLPVSDLAEQVYNVFKSQLNESSENLDLIKNQNDSSTSFNNLKVMLLSNKHQFSKEQAQLINENGKCLIDIIVTTPGRLVDHLQKTKGFCVKELRYLVLDECDRIMEQIKQNWLSILNEAIHGDTKRDLLNNECLNVHNLAINKSHLFPYQKILLSATLTRNPEKLEQMKLFQPLYFTIGAENLIEKTDIVTNKVDEIQSNNSRIETKEIKMLSDIVSTRKKLENGFSIADSELNSSDGNINVPKELNELFLELILTEKPLYAIYLIKKLGYRRMLCFVKSKDTAKRLNKLFELNNIKSVEYSSSLHGARRKRAQTRFEENKLDVLVCSDMMARGMDLTNVDYVLLYDAPKDLNSYVHKVGRTARAGRSGTAITFLEKKEIYFFKKMTKLIGSSKDQSFTEKSVDTMTSDKISSHKIKEIKIKKSELKDLVADYRKSLLDLKEALKKNNKANESSKIKNKTDLETNSNDENSETKKRKHLKSSSSKFSKRIKK